MSTVRQRSAVGQLRSINRKALHRDSSQSITTNTIMSPFVQRIQLTELKPDSAYEHNYILLRIEKVEQSQSGGRLLTCICQSTEDSTATSDQSISVQLYGEYANTSLVKPGKIISIAKFRTGPAVDTGGGDGTVKMEEGGDEARVGGLDFSIIVASPSLSRRPLIPFVSITDMIEQPTEPHVETSS